MSSFLYPYNSAFRGSGLVLFVLLLSVGAVAQSLTKDELQKVNVQLHRNVADTTRVRLLLELSAHAASHASRTTARDSALRFVKDALTLSQKTGYDTGIYRTHLHEIALWVNYRDWLLTHDEDATAALENKRTAQDKLIAFVQTNGSPTRLGEAYSDVVDLYGNQVSDLGEILQLCDSAAACFRRGGNVLRESMALYQVGFSLNRVGKLKESLPIYHRSLTLAEPTGGVHRYRVCGVLGMVYSFLGGHNVGLKYELRALQLAEAAGDTTGEAAVLHLFIGEMYEQLKNYEVAREHYDKSYRMYRYYADLHTNDFFSAANSFARVTTAANHPREAIEFLNRFTKEYQRLMTPKQDRRMTLRYMQAYAQLRDYATAQRYCDKLLTLGDPVPIVKLGQYLSIGQFLVQSKQYHAAEKYLAEAERLARETQRMYSFTDIYASWYKIDSANGNYSAALEKYKLHKLYSDSALNDVKAKEISLLEVEYETQKKQQSIALLTKDSELARQQLAQSTFQKNAILAGLVVSVVILGLVFNQYRLKKKNNVELTSRQREIETKNSVLQKVIVEKEWLLKEVHHRVKNNLQTVVSLLESQSHVLQNSEAVSAIQDSQNRVYAMSLIHQKLYQTEYRASVNMAVYLHELTEYLRDSFPAARFIHIPLDIQSVELDVSQAIPVGLIVNEAITNAIKYAFPAPVQEHCRVSISLRQDTAYTVTLTIADNGRGLPPDFDIKHKQPGLGLALIHGLARDLDGSANISSNAAAGVSIEITFTADLLLD
ncbi:histidine kinase dimerization/phosphoacceptor domain -containing protein [Parachryseolinea silvisoli]|uniref:histidine kinase dimerization/phosphoacceptor domain -containing protein n=1 Tax=Parachryseolinea silvisoli TaxID=2873601 RepID=UPI0022659910|nr:histidine kinase dimerization/phosphoacceptor domain -containing protein [Parachryseolinea silvisoli]MCD9014541.1 tetratricopeptide repeat protein [Parachryseolinea silvisoli]